jgi:hypothetical protein
VARFTDTQLRKKALSVLEDATNRAHRSKLGDEPALAFTLAWLANGCEDRGMFDWFWKSRVNAPLVAVRSRS